MKIRTEHNYILEIKNLRGNGNKQDPTSAEILKDEVAFPEGAEAASGREKTKGRKSGPEKKWLWRDYLGLWM